MTLKRFNASFDTNGANYFPYNERPQVACGIRVSADISVDNESGIITIHRSELSRYGSTTYGVMSLRAYYDLEKTRSAGSVQIQNQESGWGTVKTNQSAVFNNLTAPIAIVELYVYGSYGINPNYSLFYLGTGEPIDRTIGSLVLNERPNKPLLTSPNGGESLNSLHTVTWSPATDIDTNQPTLRYQLQLSTNNGSSWKDLVALTPPGAISNIYDFINELETSTAKIRVRAYDGTSYSEWDESNGVFTIQHNIAPSTPNNLSPSGIVIDRLKTQRLLWKHNDSPNDIQSKADIQWRSQGATLWQNIESNGPDQEYFIAPNTFPNGQIEWRVKTYDAAGLQSPWSNNAVFTAAEPTSAPTIIQPGTLVNVARPVIEWTSPSQASYQIIIEDALSTIVWDTGEIESSVKARTTGVDLINGAAYKMKIRIKDGGGLFSSYVERAITVSYTPPAMPIVETFNGQSGIAFSISTPVPSGTQPNVIGNEIYKKIDDQWIRIALNLINSFTDYAVASEESVQYRVRAIGDNGTFKETEVLQVVAPKLNGVWLHDVLDPGMTIHRFKYYRDISDSRSSEHAFRQFAGRNKPTIEHGAYAEYNLSVELNVLKRDGDMNRLEAFNRNRSTLLYRDARGRKFYTTIPSLPSSDVFYGNTIKLDLMEIDYSEEV